METAPASVGQVLASPGRPLEPALRQDMEQRFGHDFGEVRVHADAQAAQSARAVSATAYSVGHHIVFGEREWQPGIAAGRRLLAHELTHTIQQTTGGHAGLQRQPAPDTAKPDVPIFKADRRKRKDRRFARKEAQADAARIRKSGALSTQERQLVNAKLSFFEGEAFEIYAKEIKPALVAVHAGAPPPPPGPPPVSTSAVKSKEDEEQRRNYEGMTAF